MMGALFGVLLLIISFGFPTLCCVVLSMAPPFNGNSEFFRIRLFTILMIAVALPLCLVGISDSELLFIPLILATFWTPQIVLIAFFTWCEYEEKEVASGAERHIQHGRVGSDSVEIEL